MLAANSGYWGDIMQKKLYVKPEIKTEELDTSALGGELSVVGGGGGGGHDGGGWC